MSIDDRKYRPRGFHSFEQPRDTGKIALLAESATAKRLNGKIQRFITQSYGLRGKDFFLYRIAEYF
jgi:hypothetical protein